MLPRGSLFVRARRALPCTPQSLHTWWCGVGRGLWLGTVFAVCFWGTLEQVAAEPEKPHTPAAGTVERRELINAMRDTAARDLGQKVIFNVEGLSVVGDWCLARVVPRRLSGGPIDLRKTKYREAARARGFDRTGEALLKRGEGRWTLREWHFGAKDSAWQEWTEKYIAPPASPAEGIAAVPMPTPGPLAVQALASPPTQLNSESNASSAAAPEPTPAQKALSGSEIANEPSKPVAPPQVASAADLPGGEKGPGDAIAAWTKAAEAGDFNAEWNLAQAYGSGAGAPRSDAEFLRWIERAAEHGHSQAQAIMAGAYLHGEGVKVDQAKGVALAQKSAGQGNAAGQYFLGLAYTKGMHPVARDPAKAFSLFLGAAQQNDSGAQWMVAQAYANGDGVAKNPVETMRWARRAAEQGHPDAEAFLGIAYSTGDGVVEDRGEAVSWLTKAAAVGNESAKAYLEKLSSETKGSSSPGSTDKPSVTRGLGSTITSLARTLSEKEVMTFSKAGDRRGSEVYTGFSDDDTIAVNVFCHEGWVENVAITAGGMAEGSHIHAQNVARTAAILEAIFKSTTGTEKALKAVLAFTRSRKEAVELTIQSKRLKISDSGEAGKDAIEIALKPSSTSRPEASASVNEAASSASIPLVAPAPMSPSPKPASPEVRPPEEGPSLAPKPVMPSPAPAVAESRPQLNEAAVPAARPSAVVEISPTSERVPQSRKDRAQQPPYPPPLFIKNAVETDVPGNEFRLEQWSGPGHGLRRRPIYETWLVPTSGQPVRLPEVSIARVPGEADVQTDSGSLGFPSAFNFSPDRKYLLRVQKMSENTGVAYLYRRSEGLNYKPFVRDLHLQVSASFSRASNVGSNDGLFVVEFSSWESDGSLVLTLRRKKVWGWRCRFSPETGEFAEFSNNKRVTKIQTPVDPTQP
ncbi:MAG: hypothetical protein ABI871_07315 [Chthoniobacterales bacterium]